MLLKILFQKDIEDTSKRIEEIMQTLNKIPLSDNERETIKNLTSLVEKTNFSAKEMSKLGLSNDVENVLAEYSNIYTPALKEYLYKLDAFNVDQKKIRDDQLVLMSSAQTTAISAFLTITVFALLVGLFFAWNMTRSILMSLDQALTLADRVADGDLSHAPTSERKDEFGALIRSLGKMTEALRTIVNNVRDSSDHIKDASQEIATGNSDLSQRT